MTTYTIPADADTELSITVEPTTQGTRAYGLLFDADADIMAETPSRHYIGYCTACVLASVAAELLPNEGDDRHRDYIGNVGIECGCDA